MTPLPSFKDANINAEHIVVYKKIPHKNCLIPVRYYLQIIIFQM